MVDILESHGEKETSLELSVFRVLKLSSNEEFNEFIRGEANAYDKGGTFFFPTFMKKIRKKWKNVTKDDIKTKTKKGIGNHGSESRTYQDEILLGII